MAIAIHRCSACNRVEAGDGRSAPDCADCKKEGIDSPMFLTVKIDKIVQICRQPQEVSASGYRIYRLIDLIALNTEEI